MDLEKGQVGAYQLCLLVIGFLFGSSIVLSPGYLAGHDAWIAVFLAMVSGIVLAVIYTFLSKRFFGRTLVQITDLVCGPYLGKFGSLVFIWYLFHLGSLVIGNFVHFLTITTMPQTPESVFAILLTLVCAYAVINGIEVLARCGQVLVPMVLGLFTLILLLLLKDINLQNLQPVLEVPFKDLVAATRTAFNFPFAEVVAFLMLTPFLRNGKKIPIVVVSGILLGGIILTLAAIKNSGVLGPSVELYLYQNFQAERLINVGNLLTRLEILTVIAALACGFLKIAVLLYGTVLGSAQLLGLRTYRPLVIPIAILMIILSLTNFKNISENLMFNRLIGPLYFLPFQLGIPLLTLIIAIIRGLPKPKQLE